MPITFACPATSPEMRPSANPVYLDYNATTPIDPAVIDAMLPYLREHFGNPSSDHVYGRQAHQAVDRARAQVAALVGAEPSEIVFTYGFVKGTPFPPGACVA